MSFEKCSCGHCGQNIEYPAEGTGQTVPCPACEKPVTLTLSQPSSQPSAVNYIEGIKWVFKGVKLGDVESMAHLGVAYLEGKGVPKNYTEALKWLRQAAEQGNATAQNNIGFCYVHGYEVPQNFIEAEKWIREAAEQGDSVAEYHLGCL